MWEGQPALGTAQMRETVLQDNRAHGHTSLPRDQSPEADPDDSPRVLRLALERGGAVRLILDRISAGGREVGQPSAGYVAQGQLLAGGFIDFGDAGNAWTALPCLRWLNRHHKT